MDVIAFTVKISKSLESLAFTIFIASPTLISEVRSSLVFATVVVSEVLTVPVRAVLRVPLMFKLVVGEAVPIPTLLFNAST